MNDRIQFIAILISLIIAGTIFQLIRKKKLLEQYSLLWFFSAIVLLIFSVWRDLLDKMAGAMGIYYAPSALLVIVIFCGFLLFLNFSLVISKLTNQSKSLAQEIALLQNKLEKLEGKTIQAQKDDQTAHVKTN